MHQHLIHIGSAKAGSTFLQEWFRQNPQMYYAPGGLGGFHNVYGISQLAAQNINDTFRYFVTSDESLSSPRASAGSIPTDRGSNADNLRPELIPQVNACRILKSLYPNAKILYITRGFKGAITSGYSQYVREGGVLTLKELTAMAIENMEGSNVGEDAAGGYDYSFIINLYEEAFGKTNLLILPYELLHDDQQQFLSLIEEWLAIPHFDASIGRLNESLSPTELHWYPRISSVVHKTTSRLGSKAYAKLYPRYVKKVFHNKFHRIVKLLNRVKPGESLSNTDVAGEMMDYHKRNGTAVRWAARLSDDPLYAPYRKEYMLD